VSRLSPDAATSFLRRDSHAYQFTYDRDRQKIGIVHFGIGAFHRAHQAWYTDKAMNAGERDWAITGVSLRSPKVLAQLNPQQGLYSVLEKSGSATNLRLIGAIRNVLVADRHPNIIVDRIASPNCHIVSFTVTEKGYCRTPEGELDFVTAEKSFYRFLTEALARRRDNGLAGLTLLSCDNLAGNGAQLKRLMSEYLAVHAPDVVDWFENECTCPSTMVDRIVPATTDDDLDSIQKILAGFRDEAAVITEPFSQWVIEDNFAGPRPAWEKHGAQMTSDVHAYETAKLRMLNGAHSALAYLGLQRGHEYVHQAIADPELAPLIDTLMRDEAATSLTAAPGQDPSAYADALIARFKNPALNHRLAQIAMDGSQKIPQRWLETLSHHQKLGRQCPATLAGIAAWVSHIRGDNGPVDDPMAAALKAAWDAAGQEDIVMALFGPNGPIASDWVPNDADRNVISAALD
jgi:fructuronate reductase